jgi:hypothetical protein
MGGSLLIQSNFLEIINGFFLEVFKKIHVK